MNYHEGGGVGGVAKVHIIKKKCMIESKWETLQTCRENHKLCPVYKTPTTCINSCHPEFTNRRDIDFMNFETRLISPVQHGIQPFIAALLLPDTLRAWKAVSQDIRDTASLGSLKLDSY